MAGIVAPFNVDSARAEEDETKTVTGKRLVVVTHTHNSWIGGHFLPVDELVKSQLNIDHGIAAHMIVPESPAAKAGFEQHDILLKFDGKNVDSVDRLMELVEGSTGKEVNAVVMRSGSERTLKITPEKRPARYAVVPSANVFARENIDKMLAELPEGAGQWIDGNRHRMLFFAPGVAVPGNTFKFEELPKNVEVTVKRDGDKPAQVTVKSGGKEWSVSEDKVDELPAKIRVHVERMVERPKTMSFRIRQLDEGDKDKEKNIEIDRRVEVVTGTNAVDIEALKKRLGTAVSSPQVGVLQLHKHSAGGMDKLQSEIDRLRKDVDALKKQLESAGSGKRNRKKSADKSE